MLQRLAQPDLRNRTGGINFREAGIHPRPGHAEVAHRWGISPLGLKTAPRKSLYEEFHL